MEESPHLRLTYEEIAAVILAPQFRSPETAFKGFAGFKTSPIARRDVEL